MEEKPLLTICIVHYRRLSQLKKTITNLEGNTVGPFCIKVLNNGYLDDDISKYLSSLSYKSNYEIFYFKENLGPAAGKNFLIEKCDTDYIAIIDDDIYFLTSGWNKKVINILELRNDLIAVGFVFGEGNSKKIVAGGKNISISKGGLINYENLNIEALIDYNLINCDSVSGAYVFREGSKKSFIIDSTYRMVEDWERAYLMKVNNGKYVVLTDCEVIHDKSSNNKKMKSYNVVRRNYHQIRKDYIYFSKKYKLHLNLSRHLFYKYLCILPNSIIWPIIRWKLKYFNRS